MPEVHKGSQETYDFIADWIDPNFFFSKNDKWDRFGMVGVFGDYVLSCTGGDIFEIGVGESSIYLTRLAYKYNRKIYNCDVSPSKIINPMTVRGYLADDYVYSTPQDLQTPDKKGYFFAGSSDQLFKMVRLTPLALAFIDGDHVYEQVRKDFDNVLPYIVDHGYILLHDTYPPDPAWTDENRCGTVYKLRRELDLDPRFDTLTLTRGAAMGVGLTLVRKKPQDRMNIHE